MPDPSPPRGPQIPAEAISQGGLPELPRRPGRSANRQVHGSGKLRDRLHQGWRAIGDPALRKFRERPELQPFFGN